MRAASVSAAAVAFTLALAAPAPAHAATSFCLHGRMADGTHTRPGSVANNRYPLGTRVSTYPRVLGRRRWVVRDRIGWGTDWDFWNPSCAASIAYGRRSPLIRLGWPAPVYTMRLRRQPLEQRRHR